MRINELFHKNLYRFNFYMKNFNMSKILRFFFLSFLLLGAASFTLSGQSNKLKEFSVASVDDDPFDTNARSEGYGEYDSDGEYYAILKVTTDDPDDNLHAYIFDFGYPSSHIKVHESEGEIWVYVQRGAKSVTISRSGYRTITRYDLGRTFQAGNVYRMVLKVKRVPEVVEYQILQFNINPPQSGVMVTYQSEEPGAAKTVFGVTDINGSVAHNLKLGTYTYEIIANHYHPVVGRIILDEKNGVYVEDVMLRPNFAEVSLSAGPETEIFLNGEKLGVSLWNGRLSPNSYQIECKRPNHRNSSQIITVKEGESYQIELERPVPIVGTLTLFSNPLGAQISIDGKVYGTTPKTIDGLLIGTHKIAFSMKNYKTESVNVQVIENESVECSVEMEPLYSKETNTKRESDEVNGVKPSKTRVVRIITSNDWYAELGVQFISLNSISASVGKYMGGFNLELFYLYGYTRERPYLYYPSRNHYAEQELGAMSYGLKIGYGIMSGKRMRYTPQLGVGVINVSSRELNTSAVSASVGLRAECAISSLIGVSLTPEYSFSLHRNNLYKDIIRLLPSTEKWVKGFNIRLGVFFLF